MQYCLLLQFHAILNAGHQVANQSNEHHQLIRIQRVQTFLKSNDKYSLRLKWVASLQASKLGPIQLVSKLGSERHYAAVVIC